MIQAKTVLTIDSGGIDDRTSSLSLGRISWDRILDLEEREDSMLVHVRDPETGAATGEVAHYREVVARVRDAGSDLLINLTTGFGARFAPAEDDGVGHAVVAQAPRRQHDAFVVTLGQDDRAIPRLGPGDEILDHVHGTGAILLFAPVFVPANLYH